MYNENNKKYRFNEKVAIDAGFEEAVMFCNIYHWVKFNEQKEDDTYFHEGKNWMYCTVREFTEQYPFWSKAQIKRILKNLIDKGFLESGEFNKWNPDRTKWYTLTKKGLQVIENNSAFVDID